MSNLLPSINGNLLGLILVTHFADAVQEEQFSLVCDQPLTA
jgi:hypothetical protein